MANDIADKVRKYWTKGLMKEIKNEADVISWRRFGIQEIVKEFREFSHDDIFRAVWFVRTGYEYGPSQ